MSDKLNILIFIDWFTPGFKAGGPIKSVSNIVKSLHTNFNFYIITSDRDIDDNQPYPNVELNKWLQKEHYTIAYLSENNRKNFITNAIKKQNFNAYYFNSLYSKSYTLEPFQLVKKIKPKSNVIIAPRGMLGKGALKIKPLKKKAFLAITKTTGFFKNVTWHATDMEETEDIKLAYGNKVNIFQSPNISILAIKENFIEKKQNELKLVFFSRISSKKNLIYALQILTKVSSNIELDVYGSIEDVAYWEKCKQYIKENNLNVKYRGKLNPAQVQETLTNYHFLFFPTIHENFGHVIVEALSSGCGLIISTNTPWRDLNRNRVGWDIDLDKPEEYVKVLQNCLAMNNEEFNTYRTNCYNYIKSETEKLNAVEQTSKMFAL